MGLALPRERPWFSTAIHQEVDAEGGTVDSATSRPAIALDGLSKAYGSETIFEHLDFEVDPGEFLCVLGASGCGKTTLLHMIAGLVSPSAGAIRVHDAPVSGPDHRRGVVFQEPRLYPWLTVRENVAIGPRLRGVAPDFERIEDILSLVGLAEAAEHRPRNLSGGMAQRASLARTLVNEPELLLLDEPFSALDALTKMSLQDELRHIVDEVSLTTVFVTHDIEEAVYLGDRVLVLGTNSDGIRAIIDTPGEARGDEAALTQKQQLFDILEDDIETTEGAHGR